MKKYAKAIIAVVATLGATVANASEGTDAITAIGTEASSMISAAWPVLTAITVAFVSMKLFKKATNKAT
ncbi:MAG: phage coat protein [Magnetococcales bacterium]|nr:phage coat protein [Magnetococcales bacterium]